MRLEILDSGCGLRPATPLASVGVGLSSMRERLRQFGGQLEIETDSQERSFWRAFP